MNSVINALCFALCTGGYADKCHTFSISAVPQYHLVPVQYHKLTLVPHVSLVCSMAEEPGTKLSDYTICTHHHDLCGN